MYTDQVKLAMDQLSVMGGGLFVDKGIVRIRMNDGSRVRYEMLPYLDIIHANNDQVVVALEIHMQPVVLMNTDILTAKTVKQAIKAGQVELTGRLIYHMSSNRMDITYLPKVTNFCLDQYRDLLISELKHRLNVMEEQYELLIQKQTVDDWDEAKWKDGQPERDALMEEYNRINTLLTEGGAA